MPLTGIVVTVLAAVLSQTAQQPQPDGAPLSGPKVAGKAARPTIAERDLDGRVRRPEGSPEEAAARLLDLTPEHRAKLDAVFARRAHILERFIEDNLDLINRLTTAENAPGKEKFALALETLDKSKDLRENGPLDEQVRSVLPDQERRRFNRLLKEYWEGIAAEDKQQGKPKGRIGAVIDEKFKSLGRELEAAYKRCEKGGGLLYHYLFDSIEVTPEQEKPLRKLCSNYTMGGLDNKDKKSQGLMFVSLMQVLTPEQGRQLAAKFKGGEPKYQKRSSKPGEKEKPASPPAPEEKTWK
jgi:hypothetical protein